MTSHPIPFLDGRVVLRPGDCMQVLKTMPDNSVDAVITDPPYHLTSIVERFGAGDAAPAQHGTDGAFARASRGFMGKEWDGGDIAFRVELWVECLRVLKPGGYVLAFSATRSYHRMATAIEGAGFEVRDTVLDMVAADTAVVAFLETLTPEQVLAFFRCLDESAFGGLLGWCYGTGFPKSHNVSKAIDKMLGAERKVVGTERLSNDMRNSALLKVGKGEGQAAYSRNVTEAGSPEAAEWEGWGTALKPAWEPICMARKPLAGTVAENVLAHGTGAINTKAASIPAEKTVGWGGKAGGGGTWNETNSGLGKDGDARPADARFPANIVTDGSQEVFAAFPDSSGQQGRVGPEFGAKGKKHVYGEYGPRAETPPRGDDGSAARFFYSAKADGDDRLNSKHPTVKPLELMQWLVRLVCRKGATVLDPFAGTGTTGHAAYFEGCNAILIERDPEYQRDIAERMRLALAGPEERKRARTKLEPVEALPLFGELSHAHGVDEMQTPEAAE